MIRVIDETGPAEAATSPGRGSNNSSKESAVNSQPHNTALSGAARAPFDYKAAFNALEDPICDAVARLNVLSVIIDDLADRPVHDDAVRVPESRLSAAIFMFGEVHSKLEEADKVYQSFTLAEMAGVSDEIERARRIFDARDRDLDELGELIFRHRAATISWNVALEEAAKASLSPSAQTPREKETHAAWDQASRALLSWRPGTLEGNAARIKYLTDDQHGLWRDTQPEEGELWMLFTSMMEVA